MIRREFLGWDRPFSDAVVEWLLAQRGELPYTTVVVPTSQSGRLLRAALVKSAGAILSPRIVTPGGLLATDSPEIATGWQEELAWLDVLSAVEDWGEFSALFPDPPLTGGGGAEMLAREFAALRFRLQQNGLTLARAAQRLAATTEAARWQALADLEARVENRLAGWRLTSRSHVLAETFRLPVDPACPVILAGVADPAPLLCRLLAAHKGGVTALIAAPEEEAASFSPEGIPLESIWCRRALVSPMEARGGITLVADARVQADAALARVIDLGAGNTKVALGAPDADVAEELARVFTSAGWSAFVPGEHSTPWGLRRWLKTWREWLENPVPAVMADLLALPETAVLLGTANQPIARELAILRNAWMPATVEELQRRFAAEETWRSEEHQQRAAAVDGAAARLLQTRTTFLRTPFSQALPRLLEKPAARFHPDDDGYNSALEFTHATAPWSDDGRRGNSFWLGLLLAHLPDAAITPPEDRALDVSGWLELLHNPSPHLVLCGMNDGHVPPRDTGDPWLGDKAAQLLGLPVGSQRWARDAFLYHSLVSSRIAAGSATVFCGRANSAGDILQPSRLLLATPPAELPARVRLLFRDVDPPEAGLPWAIASRWIPPLKPVPETMNVTAFRSYLQCPFRFYLKHILGMQSPDPGRVEWNQRDFGNIAHNVLETWGRDPAACNSSDESAIAEYLLAQLDGEILRTFGSRPPLAIRIQKEALAQRLVWFSRLQAVERSKGWKIVAIEKPFTLPLEGITVKGKIDRIDRHEATGDFRVIDYKTGKIKSVEDSHRKQLRGELPAHHAEKFTTFTRGEKTYLWTDLQLPLYAAAWREETGILPQPCYFTLAETNAESKFAPWETFEPQDADDARACAAWILRQISAGVFRPPAAKVPYDDFAFLAAGRTLEETCSPPGGGDW